MNKILVVFHTSEGQTARIAEHVAAVMRAIAKREGGDTDVHHDYEYTDWHAVERFAHDVHTLVGATARQAP